MVLKMDKKYVKRRRILERVYMITLAIFIFSICGIVGNIESMNPVLHNQIIITIISGIIVRLFTPIINGIMEIEYR